MNKRSKTKSSGHVELDPKFKRALSRQRWIPVFFFILVIITVIGLIHFYNQNPVRTNLGMFYPNLQTVEMGDRILATENERNIINVFLNPILIQNETLGTVVAGPYGEIRFDRQRRFYYIDLEDRRIKLEDFSYNQSNRFLSNEFLIFTTNGNYVIIHNDNIQGILN